MYEYIFLPAVSALIGWLTNVLAIRLIFRPYKPWRLPLLGYEIQGLLPRRQKELARSIGEAIERELISAEDILGRLASPELRREIINHLVSAVERSVASRMPAFIPSGVSSIVLDFVVRLVRNEAAAFFDKSLDRLRERVRGQLRLSQIIQERLENLDLMELEDLVVSLAGRELRHIEVLGGILGFIIGWLQVLLLVLVRHIQG